MAIDTRQLEPTPGWCERAATKLRDQLDSPECRCGWCSEVNQLLGELSATRAKPATPEPLPHEWLTVAVSGDLRVYRCRYCSESRSKVAPDGEPLPGRCRARIKPEPTTVEEIGEELAAGVQAIFGTLTPMKDSDPTICGGCGYKTTLGQLRGDDRGHFVCPECFERRCKPEAAANYNPEKRIWESLEKQGSPFKPATEPAAKGAELPFDIRCQFQNIFPGDTVKQFCLEGLARAILAEARRIARHESGVKYRDMIPEQLEDMRRIAREEIAAATVEMHAYGEHETWRPIENYRIIPGAK